ncbi:IS110 family transposase [Streptomyces mirabilis]
MNRTWAGINAGKGHHHCVVINGEGAKLLSRRVMNDESELLNLLADVLELGDEVPWASKVTRFRKTPKDPDQSRWASPTTSTNSSPSGKAGP